jgi:hypothetical protein
MPRDGCEIGHGVLRAVSGIARAVVGCSTGCMSDVRGDWEALVERAAAAVRISAMANRVLPLLVVLAAVIVWPSAAAAATTTHECQHPVRTGVEVYHLHAIATTRACPVALALFAWETSSAARQRALYGCKRPHPDAAGYPYLRLHRFRGWKLSLAGKPYGEFTMTRGASSFRVIGTDFPLNCT